MAGYYTGQGQDIATFAVPYKTLLTSYPKKTEYVFQTNTAWQAFEKKHFKKSGTTLPASVFNKEDVIAVFPKTKKKNVDIEVQKVVDRGTFIEVVLAERAPKKPMPKNTDVPLSYLLAGIPKLNKPVYFSRKIY